MPGLQIFKSICIYIYIYIYIYIHPHRNRQVVSNFENIGCFYAIERMRGMRVGETMLIKATQLILIGETVLR